MWCQQDMPLLPVGGFTFTETHREMGGLDRRFHGVFWDADLYMHQHQLGGRTTLLQGHEYHEQNPLHNLFTAFAPRDGEVLKMLWPEPLTPDMKRSCPRECWDEDDLVRVEEIAYG